MRSWDNYSETCIFKVTAFETNSQTLNQKRDVWLKTFKITNKRVAKKNNEEFFPLRKQTGTYFLQKKTDKHAYKCSFNKTIKNITYNSRYDDTKNLE